MKQTEKKPLRRYQAERKKKEEEDAEKKLLSIGSQSI